MSDFDLAEQLNNEGVQLRDDGDIAGAETAYRAAAAAAPEWSVPVYNLGLLYKYEGRWQESLACNKQAAMLAPDDEASWWNLGIAATALGEWNEARRAWEACGIEVPSGDGPPEFNWGDMPVRLDPTGQAEVVWARRLDPARAQIVSVPLPSSPFHWGDIILTDGAEEGQRIVDGRTYSVFNALQLLALLGFRTFILELPTAQPEALAALYACATDHGGAAEAGARSLPSSVRSAVAAFRTSMRQEPPPPHIHTWASRLAITHTRTQSSVIGWRIRRAQI